MGRKGMKGFLKSAGKAHDSDEEEQAAKPAPKAAPAADKAPAAQKPAAAAAPASDEEEEEQHGPETRSRMLQRHKREMLAHKKALQRSGKKSKDELAKLNKEIEDRHAKELAALDAGESTPAAAAEAPAAGAEASTSTSSKPAGAGGAVQAQAAAAAGGAAAEADKASKFLKDMSLDAAAAPSSRKPSKAQKRKEKQAAKDAEREARIAAELEALGTTERQAEEEALRALLAPLGLKVKEIRADGHCLYRSVEDQLEQLAAVAAAAAAADDEPAAAAAAADGGDDEVPQYGYQELRELAAGYIRTHREQFAPFLLPEDPEQDPGEYLENYCQTLEGTAAWGGHVELHALAGALRRQIKVFAAHMPPFSVGDEYAAAAAAAAAAGAADSRGGKGRASLQLCYLQHAFGLGEHYNSVKRVRIAAGGEEEEEEEEEAGEGKKVRWRQQLTEHKEISEGGSDSDEDV